MRRTKVSRLPAMKTSKKITWMLGVALGALPFVCGCTQQNAGASQSDTVLTQSASSQAYTNALAGQPNRADKAASGECWGARSADTNTPPISTGQGDKVEPAVKPGSEKPLPGDIFFSPALRDVIRMAEAGIEESVLLSYISNSTSTFNLGAEQIIYLNDIGIPESVMLAMIEHDTRLGVPGGQAVVPETQAAQAEPAPATTAAAPATEQYDVPKVVPEPTVVNYNYFYDTLAPYGNWIMIDGYGWCWQPTVVVIHAGWHPYCHHGRWLYSDWGWYWQSDYTWGRIVFHYGRWFRHPRWGWCWWPDRVWAPAWVVWRYTDYYCGWAPLPPFTGYSTVWGMTYFGVGVGINFDFGLHVDHYTYVPWHRFGHHRPDRYRIHHERIRHVHDRAVVVNDFAYGDRHMMRNRGIPFDYAVKRAGREIPRVTVRDLPGKTPPDRVPDRPHREGNQLVVYRYPVPERQQGNRIAEKPAIRFDRPGPGPGLIRGERPGDAPRQFRPGQAQPDAGVVRDRSRVKPETDGLHPDRGISAGQGPVVPRTRPGNEVRTPAIRREPSGDRPQLGPPHAEPAAPAQPAQPTQPSPRGPARDAGAQPVRPQPNQGVITPTRSERSHSTFTLAQREIQRPAIRPAESGGGSSSLTPAQIKSDQVPSHGTGGTVIGQPAVQRQIMQSQPIHRAEPPQTFTHPGTPARTEAPARVIPPSANVVVQRPVSAPPAPVPRASAPVVSAPTQPVQRHVSVPSTAPASSPSTPPPAPVPRSSGGSDPGAAPTRSHKAH